MTAKKVGLALGGGGARGLSHIGVLAVLEREHVPVDMIAGTSIGAVVGGLYALRHDAAELRDIALSLAKRRINYWLDPVLPRSGLAGGHRIEKVLRSLVGEDITFNDLRLPFACVAADVDTGEEVVLDSGPVWKAIRASATVPVVLEVAEVNGRYLVDGGLVNPVPVSVLQHMGADLIIAVNVLPDRSKRSDGRPPNIFTIIVRTLYIYSSSLLRSSMEGAGVIIEPDVADIAFAEFRRAEECIGKGEAAAEKALDDIRHHLAAAGITPA